MNTIPLSIYVHLPYCVRKCPYCDFNSHATENAPTNDYVSALLRDVKIEAASDRAAGRSVQSVFFGGGTPSLFSAKEIGTILSTLHDLFDISANAEITLEANPGTLEFEDPQGYRVAGVNRLSLGAQSFSEAALKRLGRIHGPEEIHRAYAAARAGGFDNINVDLMHGLPGQTMASAKDDIDSLLRLAPEHISYYQLTLEPNTVFHTNPPQDLPDEKTSWAIQQDATQRFVMAGYKQYEVSAFALPERSSRHNLNYWQFGDYLALGAGAHGKFTDATGAVWRYAKPMHPRAYMDQVGSEPDLAQVAGDDLDFEFMLNALRLNDGFTETLFETRTGHAFCEVADTVERLQQQNLLETDGEGAWWPSIIGRRFVNDLQAAFLPAERARLADNLQLRGLRSA